MRFYQNKDVCNYPCTDCGEVSTTQAPTTAMTTAPTATSTKDPTEGGNFTFVKFPTSQELTGAYFKSPRNGEMWMTRYWTYYANKSFLNESIKRYQGLEDVR